MMHRPFLTGSERRETDFNFDNGFFVQPANFTDFKSCEKSVIILKNEKGCGTTTLLRWLVETKNQTHKNRLFVPSDRIFQASMRCIPLNYGTSTRIKLRFYQLFLLYLILQSSEFPRVDGHNLRQYNSYIERFKCSLKYIDPEKGDELKEFWNSLIRFLKNNLQVNQNDPLWLVIDTPNLDIGCDENYCFMDLWIEEWVKPLIDEMVSFIGQEESIEPLKMVVALNKPALVEKHFHETDEVCIWEPKYKPTNIGNIIKFRIQRQIPKYQDLHGVIKRYGLFTEENPDTLQQEDRQRISHQKELLQKILGNKYGEYEDECLKSKSSLESFYFEKLMVDEYKNERYFPFGEIYLHFGEFFSYI
jgi:hypothetical protein